MRRLFSQTYGSILAHLLMWCMLGALLLLWQPLIWRIDIPVEFWYKQALLFLLLLGLFYTNSEVLVPKLLNQNRVSIFIIVNLGLALLVSFLIKQLDITLDLRQLMNQAFRAAREGGVMKREEFVDYFSLLISLIILGVSTITATIRSWQNNRRAREELEKQKLESELSFLKAQINPHFFFNTLNNIYALTQLDSEKAGVAIHRLSRMMRYVLYDTLQDKVTLSQEVAFLTDYVDLMKLRLTDKVELQIDISSPISEATIAPMLFLPFVENAFKHGTSATDVSKIKIELKQRNNEIHLSVTNTLFAEKKHSLEEGYGIGLINTRRRLDILYPNRYELVIDENTKDKTFSAYLKLITN